MMPSLVLWLKGRDDQHRTSLNIGYAPTALEIAKILVFEFGLSGAPEGTLSGGSVAKTVKEHLAQFGRSKADSWPEWASINLRALWPAARITMLANWPALADELPEEAP